MKQLKIYNRWCGHSVNCLEIDGNSPVETPGYYYNYGLFVLKKVPLQNLKIRVSLSI